MGNFRIWGIFADSDLWPIKPKNVWNLKPLPIRTNIIIIIKKIKWTAGGCPGQTLAWWLAWCYELTALTSPPSATGRSRRAVIHIWTAKQPWRWRCVFRGRLTGGAGPVGHPRDGPLLFAGRLPPVALVLVGVSVGSAHGHVVFAALEIKHSSMLMRLRVTGIIWRWIGGDAVL